MQSAGVSVGKVSKRFADNPVLTGVDLEVEPGEFLTLVGPSGCGKSTLLRLIAGLEQADSGAISIGGQRVDHLRPSARNVAMVFQNYALYPHMHVKDNIATPLVMARQSFAARIPLFGRLIPGSGAKNRQIRAEVTEIARLLEIEQLLNRKPGELSGGQRQRVALARAMVRRPGVFLMDEPLSNLDALLRAQVRTELAELHRRLETTFIFVTHDQIEAMTMSQRIAVMMEGRIVQIGTPAEIYGAPADIRVARFIGAPLINTLIVERSAQGLASLFGAALHFDRAVAPGPMQIAIRPEDVEISLPRPVPPAAGSVPARLRHLENLGNEVVLYLDVVDASTSEIRVRLPARGWEAMRGAGGASDPLLLHLPTDKLLAFDHAGRRVTLQRETGQRNIEAVV